jgi:hypothetical protein
MRGIELNKLIQLGGVAAAIEPEDLKKVAISTPVPLLEPASHLNSCSKLKLSDPALLLKGRKMLHRSVSMLTGVVNRAYREGCASHR